MDRVHAHPIPASLLGFCVALTMATYVVLALAWRAPGYMRTGMETFWFSTWPALFLAYPVVGALVAARHRRNAVGWLFCAVGLLWAVAFFATAYASYGLKAYPGALPGGATANWLQAWTFFPCLGLILVYVPLLFPNGRLLHPRWRIVAWTGAVGIVLVAMVFAFEPGPLDDGLGGFANPYGILPDPLAIGFAVLGFPLTLGSAIAAATSMVIRLRRARGVEREQLKWIAFAAAILAVAFAIHLALQFSGLADRVWWYGILWGAALCGIPVAAGIAIFRRGLFDIDLVINRALVYAALTLIVVGGYVFIVAGADALLRSEGGMAPPLLATGVIAVLFAPLRERVQRGVNRLLYGERDEPYAVLARLGQRLEGTLAAEALLPAITRTLTEALRLPYAAIALTGEDLARLVAASGVPGAEVLRLPLVYQQTPVGTLLVAPRGPGEGFSAAEQRLLGDLARQIGVAAHAVHLTEELQQARMRLVTAREEERRRLRRDLHDGLGSQLAALALQTGALRLTISRDPEAAAAQAAELRSELQAAVGDIRRLVHGLRPPALDELGLVGALRQRAARFGTGGGMLPEDGTGDGASHLVVTVIATEPLPPLPAAVEVAVYRIVEEALTNVVKHATATACVVRLDVGDRLSLTIEDDGVGLPREHVAGVGLRAMRERAEELGGRFTIATPPRGMGTRLVVCLPLPKPKHTEATGR